MKIYDDWSPNRVEELNNIQIVRSKALDISYSFLDDDNGWYDEHKMKEKRIIKKEEMKKS